MLIYVGKCLSFGAGIGLFHLSRQSHWPRTNATYMPANLVWNLFGGRQVLLCRLSEMIKQRNGLSGV